ncbi:MAG: class I SAM-dependent methyltransferase [Dehalococcoidia bacterium]|nr:class I SAM-dependent methyltransferase [Dehalococcoidia bacterium]
MNLLDVLLYRGQHTCPWWCCFTFDNPLRRRLQNPDLILKGLVQQGQTALDIGCGMGYFSLALAKHAGPSGRVVCVDMQDKMLEAAKRRAERAGLSTTMQFHKCTSNSLGLNIYADFALAFWMVHEVGDQGKFIDEVRALLKPGGTFLLVEPRLHVTEAAFNKTASTAEACGFEVVSRPAIAMSRAVLLRKS